VTGVTGEMALHSAKLNNTIWLNGAFEKGVMNSSSFNPYVYRPGNSLQKQFQKDVEKLGFEYYIVRSLEQFKQIVCK
jgi:hypothetical protein